MAVRIRMKRIGRRHRPFFRICAMDGRTPRDGRVIEELGYYDPMVRETDARAVLNGERIDYWLGVGAKPSEKVGVLIKKYGTNGTHAEQQQQALQRIETSKPQAPPPMKLPPLKAEGTPETPAEADPAEAAPAEGEAAAAAPEAPAEEAKAEAAPAEAEGGETATEEKSE